RDSGRRHRAEEPGGASGARAGHTAGGTCRRRRDGVLALHVWNDGRAQGAIHRHRDLVACRHYGIDVLGATETDRTLATSKLFFAYALGNALLIPLFVGARTFLEPRWAEPDAVARTVTEFRPTLLFSVPTFYARMLRAELPRDTFRSVRACVSAGEHLPADVYDAWRERFDIEILDGLGATETIFMILANRPGTSRAGSTGKVVPGTAARLLDTEGRPVPDGTPGVLHVRTPSASPGYWNHPDHTRRTFRDGWFRTGDLLTRDAEGFYYHRGRADDVFKVAGQWVAPADVERVLLAHAGVVEAAVVGAAEAGRPRKAVRFRGREDRHPRRAFDRGARSADRRAPGAAPAPATHHARRRATAHRHRQAAAFRAQGANRAAMTEPHRTSNRPPAAQAGLAAPATTMTIAVRWGDVDLAGIAFYPRFYEWYDVGCEALFASLGLAWPETFPKYDIVGVPIL